jgi:hypothetical protein
MGTKFGPASPAAAHARQLNMTKGAQDNGPTKAVELTAEIVAAYLANNALSPTDIRRFDFQGLSGFVVGGR